MADGGTTARPIAERLRQVERFKNLHDLLARLPLLLLLDGVDPNTVEFDMDGARASMGLDASVNRLTYRELQERRELIRRRMRDHVETERPRLAR